MLIVASGPIPSFPPDEYRLAALEGLSLGERGQK